MQDNSKKIEEGALDMQSRSSNESAMKSHEESKESAYIYILFWMASSVSLILFNKAILSTYNFPYPMFLTGWHMLFATCSTQILAATTNMLPGVAKSKVGIHLLIKKFFVIALLYSISLICANKTYLYLPVSYIQMLKAFTPVCILIISILTGLQKEKSWLEGGIVFIISLGIAITSMGELNFSAFGAILQFTSILCESTRLVLTNILIKDMKLDPLSTLYYLAPVCLVLITTAFYVFEMETFNYAALQNTNFLLLLVFNGLIAFSLNIASVLLMGKASALILALSGIAKDILLVTFSVLIFGSVVTNIQVIGYAIALAGLHLHKEYKRDPITAYNRFLNGFGFKSDHQ